MISEFSEFSFGYAATRQAERDLAKGYTSKGAPVFPSLLEEFHVGWDVALQYVEAIVCLQFKRSDWVSKRHPASPTWDHIGRPHSRFSLDADGHQHRALVDLQHHLLLSGEGSVFYVAPRFHTYKQFDRHYRRRSILQASTFVLPDELPAGSGRHHVTYTATTGVQIHSDPRPLEVSNAWPKAVHHLTARPLRHFRAASDDTQARAERLADVFESAVESLRPRHLPRRKRESPLDSIEEAAVALWLSLVVIRIRSD